MKCLTPILFLTLMFGVYSVSLPSSYSFPVSNSNFSNFDLDSDTILLTRSSRDAGHNESYPISRKPIQDILPLSPGSHNLSIGVGQIFLMGELSSNYENSLGTQIHYTYGVSDLFSFESDFGYSSHSNGNFSLVNLDAAVRTNLIYFDQLIPFASLGLGFYRPSQILNNASVSALLFGLQLGGGVDLLLSKKIFFGTRMNFHDMFNTSKTASNGTIQNVGGSFLSFMIHAGVTF